jgi:protein-tyrosine phosphatase/nicotinamidase-related amidase
LKAILITDCLQHDFVAKIGRFDPLPNGLHVGHEESRRLLGEDPTQGPVARTLAWAHSEPRERLEIIHVRDWHDLGNPAERAHLAQFGAHCVRGTPGAGFVFSTEGVAAERFSVVDATTLSNFVGGGLGAVLDERLGDRALGAAAPRIGLMGVWTEAKITFLAYELRVRYPACEIAVCSALTASSSRHSHFLALDQMQRILGVRVLPAVGDFIDYLGGQMASAPLIGFSEQYPEVVLAGAGDGTPVGHASAELAATDVALLRYLFRGARSVRARALAGGFSGNAVLATESVDLQGHEQVPHVVKIGPRAAIAEERTAFERIEGVLGNSAPRVTDFADLDGRGAIKYRYAAMGRGPSRSFQQLFVQGASQAEVERILDIVFDEQLGRFYRAAELERCDLLDYYGFSERWAPSVQGRVNELVGAAGGAAAFELGGRTLPNIARFYASGLAALPRGSRTHYLAQVHGDLNGANIIVDARGNVWLIDFFHCHRGHVLRDLAKLENDLLYIFTELGSERELEQALDLSDRLLAVEDLGRPLDVPAEAGWSPALKRAWVTVGQLRKFYPELVRADRDPMQLLIAQIRYAVHTLDFVESSRLQKLWALYTASRAAAELERRLWRDVRLRVDWLPPGSTGQGRLGITILPGRRDMGRELARDIETLLAERVDAVVCLISPEEFRHYGVEGLLTAYRSAGLAAYHQPILDGSVPSAEELLATVTHVVGMLALGKRVVVHCAGGLGRAGTVAACTLRALGMTAEHAIDEVRTARSLRAIETPIQEQTIYLYSHAAGPAAAPSP